jgi:hypothetical protein
VAAAAEAAETDGEDDDDDDDDDKWDVDDSAADTLVTAGILGGVMAGSMVVKTGMLSKVRKEVRLQHVVSLSSIGQQ